MTAPLQVIAVDDDPALRRMVNDYLTQQGYALRLAEDGAALDRLLATAPADLLLLDMNLPGEDGLRLAARLRAADPRLGIIMLTAVAEEASRVACLQAGADDFIVKPFALRELLARLRSVARRLPPLPKPAAASALLAFGHFRIDAAGRRLLAPDGQEVVIGPAEFALLLALARHPRQILGRDRLSQLAHGRALAPGERSLDIQVTRLRGRLGRHGSLIRTLRGEGYGYDPDASEV